MKNRFKKKAVPKGRALQVVKEPQVLDAPKKNVSIPSVLGEVLSTFRAQQAGNRGNIISTSGTLEQELTGGPIEKNTEIQTMEINQALTYMFAVGKYLGVPEFVEIADRIQKGYVSLKRGGRNEMVLGIIAKVQQELEIIKVQAKQGQPEQSGRERS